MLDLQRGAKLSKLVVEESHVGVRHVSGLDVLLRSTDITHEVIPEVRWHCVHEPAGWDGQYLERKK